ncbi:MAG: hypothetical protein L0Z73_20395, partial [Gammaproteobacteria bacterium]|nr:hypothetical protein [Gammaproteobacteria bacterium]
MRCFLKYRWVVFSIILVFSCNTTSKVEVVSGHFEEKFIAKASPGKVFDAQQADFLNSGVKWGLISVEGSPADTGMRWIGGFVYSNKPWDASWDFHKDLHGPTRNSAAINIAAPNMTVNGLHFFNVHDGVRTNNASH